MPTPYTEPPYMTPGPHLYARDGIEAASEARRLYAVNPRADNETPDDGPAREYEARLHGHGAPPAARPAASVPSAEDALGHDVLVLHPDAVPANPFVSLIAHRLHVPRATLE